MDPETQFLRERQETISQGLKDAIRAEVQKLRESGLPVYVSDNGKVVDLQKTRPKPQSN